MYTVYAITESFTTIGQISVVQAAMSQPNPYHYLKTESVSSLILGMGAAI